MSSEAPDDLRLWLPDRDAAICDREEINVVLKKVGAFIWPLDTASAPAEIRELLDADTLDQTQSQQVQDHFLLPRERLLECIKAAGRTLGTAGGGFLSTTDKTHSVTYPQLYQVLEGVDYSRFDRFHVNRSPTQTGVDEVMHVLSGNGIVLRQKIPEYGAFQLEIDCPPDHGWTLTYDGDLPHIGSISGASRGSKILMQIIGPAEWEMIYL
ncbi:hypothetical protein RUE5091_04119 [Ruegeria denitrificans]|uniref:Uncharacterized protein n=1 Tax=Ruegeria denitrificans TaxID=1715692 RepID=A0A0P1IJS9_9RHOB|nr:hypothetical protein [Ruegeria denitrificans]CUK17435.1 hypothetical protein RUE5091_04119 [Ruegeria denitrificans]